MLAPKVVKNYSHPVILSEKIAYTNPNKKMRFTESQLSSQRKLGSIVTA